MSAYAVSIAFVLSYLLVACGIKWSFFFSLFFFALPLSHAPVCRFKTPPCVHLKASPCLLATRAHVFQHVGVVPVHGVVLNVHSGTFRIYTPGVLPACDTTQSHRTHTTKKTQHTRHTLQQNSTPQQHDHTTHINLVPPKTVNDALCVWLCGFDFSCLSVFKIARHPNIFDFFKITYYQL